MLCYTRRSPGHVERPRADGTAECRRMTDAPGLPAAPRVAPLASAGDDRQLNIFRTLARNKPLYKGFLALGGHLLGGGGLPAREREIVILRTGFRCGSEYEFGQHTRIGRDAGLTDAEVERLAGVALGDSHGDSDWSDGDRALID